MIIVTIWEHEGTQRVSVHAANEDGTDSTDVTDQYKVHALVVQATDGSYVAGWHVGVPCDEPQHERYWNGKKDGQ